MLVDREQVHRRAYRLWPACCSASGYRLLSSLVDLGRPGDGLAERL